MRHENGGAGIARAQLTGLILAGGRARRLQDPAAQGADLPVEKGLVPLGGQPLVAVARAWLAPRVGTICISANRRLADYATYGRLVCDPPELAAAGPLAGVAAAMASSDTPWLLTVPVDVPFLPEDLLERLAAALVAGGASVAYAASADGEHPLCLLARCALLPSLRTYLLDGGRRVSGWLQQHDAQKVWFDGDAHEFMNINTLDDLSRAEQWLRHRPGAAGNG